MKAWLVRPENRPGKALMTAGQGTWLYDVAIRTELGEAEDVIGGLTHRNNDNGSCHHAFLRHVDHIIARIGAGRPVTLPGAGEERERIHGIIAHAGRGPLDDEPERFALPADALEPREPPKETQR